MSYYPNNSPLICFFNNVGHDENALVSNAEFTTSLHECFIDSSDNTILKSSFPMTLGGDLRYSFVGSGGLRSIAYFNIDGTDSSVKGRSENGGGSGTKGVSPEVFFAKTNSLDEIKVVLNKKSSVTLTYSTDYTRVTGLVK